MRTDKPVAVVLALATTVVVVTGVSAHRLDEYLQAARLGVEPNRVDLELDLTPGAAVADAIMSDIDRDHDGVLSPLEQRAYVARVLNAVELHVDGRPLHAGPVSATFPTVDAFRRGEGTIQLRSAVVLPALPNGNHQLSFRNTNRRDASVYVANALVPDSDRIAVTAQRRDGEQSDLTIDYVMRPAAATSRPVWLFGAIAGAVVLGALLMRPPTSRDHSIRALASGEGHDPTANS